MSVTTSHVFVVRSRASSSTVIRSSPDDPMSTNSSPPSTGGPGHVGDVGHDGVHRHVADQRDPPPADQRARAIRQGPRPAVAVAERQRRDPTRASRPERRAVADPGPGRQVRDADRAGDQRQDRSQASPRSPATSPHRRELIGHDAVDRQPGPDAVVGDGVPGQERRARRDMPDRQVDPGCAMAAAAASNRATWAAVPVASSTAWKWVHRPASATPGRTGDERGGRHQVVAGQAAPAEPGLDLEMDAEGPARRPARPRRGRSRPALADRRPRRRSRDGPPRRPTRSGPGRARGSGREPRRRAARTPRRWPPRRTRRPRRPRARGRPAPRRGRRRRP